ncbi:MAG TPA: UvrD-helicase domain-containing protein [Candidatus Limnocylindrales bacterium]|nr:UvrD-helicase domain-containing protein [Candidatus Limnocylindrales bacterium]
MSPRPTDKPLEAAPDEALPDLPAGPDQGFDWPLEPPPDLPPVVGVGDHEDDPRRPKRARGAGVTAAPPDDDAPHAAEWFAPVAGRLAPVQGTAEAPIAGDGAGSARRSSTRGSAALEKEILARLNPEQARAVTTTEGPLLILAGAGSGKTRVMAHRVAYLIGVKGVRPWQILAVTFTNKAAGEMRERILGLVGEAGREVAMGTFHALCARVLRRDGAAIGVDPRFTIYDTDDQQGLMKQVLRDLELIGTGETRPSVMLAAVSRWKNDLLGPDEAATGARTYHEQMAAKAYRRYEERLHGASGLDFDDLLLYAVRLFEERPAVLAHYQQRWRYLHVDEYQDTNRAQYLWVKALAAAHRNLAVVGDDDQSIYSWRGADLRNILDFERDYPDAAVIKLEQNYRSTQLILEAAHSVVSRNEGRKDKKLWTQNPRGVLIERFEADSEDEEAEWVARQIEALVQGRGAFGSLLARRADEGDERLYRLRDIAVMYRTNAQSRAIEEAFLRYGLRYQLVGGTRFYQRREVKDALAYLRALRNDHDVAAFERIINVPARGIGERTLEVVRELAAGHGGDVWTALILASESEQLAARTRNALAGFVGLVRRLRGRIGVLALPELLDAVLEESGYRAMLHDGSEEGEERWANLLELREVVDRYADLAPEDALDRLLEETALVADQDQYAADADAVTLITLHAAKGLEFDVVFITGIEEGVFPHSRALDDPRQMEEERRLAYVGLTRARHRLYLTHAARRATWGRGGFSTPSRFLLEIPAELMHGPRLVVRDDDEDEDQRPMEERVGGPLDLDLVLGPRGGTRLVGRGGPRRAGPRVLPPGGGYAPLPPGAPRPGEPFRPSRDLAARREAYYRGPTGAVPAPRDEQTGGVAPPRPVVPGQRRYRDGDRVRHRAFGEGRVVTSKLTRDDEEVTVAFPGRGVKTLLASIAELERLD